MTVNRKRVVVVRLINQTFINEEMTRDLLRYPQDPLVGDPPRPDLGMNHLHPLFLKPIRHVIVPMIAVPSTRSRHGRQGSAQTDPSFFAVHRIRPSDKPNPREMTVESTMKLAILQASARSR